MNNEIWRDIKDYEGIYQILSFGNIKSYDRYDNNNHYVLGRFIKTRINKYGYIQTHLSKNGKYKTYLVHRLVALNFIFNNCNKPKINHKDGNKLNNCIENLEWVTAKENAIHAFKNNLTNPAYGERAFGCKLNEEKILKIRQLYREGIQQNRISEIYGISKSQIYRIVTYQRWKHLP